MRQSKLQKIYEKQLELEKKREFAVSVESIQFKETKAAVIDENYVYLNKKKSFKFFKFLVDIIAKSIGRILLFFMHSLRIKGRKNYKKIENTGIVTVSNHVLYLDSLSLINLIRFKRKIYFIAKGQNIKNGFSGMVLKSAVVLPLTSNFKASKNLLFSQKEILKTQKDVVHYYAEKEMWLYYRKPRPLDIGAFSVAINNDVPILPIFFTFKDRWGLNRLLKRAPRVIMNVLEPIYIKDENLSKNAKANLAREIAQQRQTECYEDFYNTKLVYED